MSRARTRTGALAALALGATSGLCGCFTFSAADVRVRDPAAASLLGPGRAPLLEPGGEDEAVVARGTMQILFDREPYEVTARREDGGGIALHCALCEEVGFPAASGLSTVTLLGADGVSRPVPTSDLVVHPDAVTADFDVCMVTLGRHGRCAAETRTRLSVPIADVIEVHRRVEPVRAWGYLLLGVSVALLAATNYGLFTAHDASDRAAFAFIGLPPALFLGGIGLWEALAPVRETTFRPAQ